MNFEEIAKNRVFNAIKRSNLTDMKILRDAYIELKNRLGEVPKLEDFITHNSLDPLVIVGKYVNYYRFLLKLKEIEPVLSSYEEQVITMLSQEILNGKRKHEVLLLELLLSEETVSHEEFLYQLQAQECTTNEETLKSVERIFNLSFFNQAMQKKYGNQPILMREASNNWTFNATITERLKVNPIFKDMLIDIVNSAAALNEQYSCEKPLTLYKKYTRKDACRLLNWNSDESSTIYGYKTKHGTCPIFVTYHKHDEVESSVAYTEGFINPEVFKWSTRSNRTLASEEVIKIIHAKDQGIDLHLFVKKDDDEGGDFYYLGEVTPDKNMIEQSTMEDKNGKEIPVVHMEMIMEKDVESKLYRYITSEEI